MKEEIDRGITIKSTGVTMAFRYSEEHAVDGQGGEHYLLNLIDSPGHADFSAEVTAALRVSDGALVVVDCIEGVCVQTETVLRQAIAERVCPTLMLNKLDRVFLELQMDGEQAYHCFRKAIESVNVVVAPFSQSFEVADLDLDPRKGNVAFGSGLMGWAFTLKDFAKLYAPKFKMSVPEMMDKLWGDVFLDAEQSKWRMGSPEEHLKRGLKRSFVQFVIEPLMALISSIRSGKHKKLEKMLSNIGLTHAVKSEEISNLEPKALMKKVLGKWLPCADALLEMMVLGLPSPAKAQAYRAQVLYDGPMDDAAAQAIVACDSKGPLMMFVSKMIPADVPGRFLAFGRVFSGTIRPNEPVRILGPNYDLNTGKDIYRKSITKVLVMVGSQGKEVDDVPCGNNVALVGVDNYLVHAGTITSLSDAQGFKMMKYTVSPVVRVAVDVKSSHDLPKLIESLRRLQKADNMVQCLREETGEHIIAAAGELHLEVCLKQLEEFTQSPLKVSDPIVSHRETVEATCGEQCLTKSANGLNRLFGATSAMPDGLSEAIEEGVVHPSDEFKVRARTLEAKFGMDATEMRRIWAFGPDATGPNLLVDSTHGIQNLSDIRDSCVAGFQWAMKEGPLTEEPCRGVIVRLNDALVHPDSAHHSSQQVLPAMRSLCHTSILSSEPSLMEPVFQVNISTHAQEVVGTVYNSVAQRRGQVFEEVHGADNSSIMWSAYVPVAESFGLSEALRKATSGRAAVTMQFHHWERLKFGDVLDPTSKAHGVALKVRARKGLDPNMPVRRG